MKTAITIALGDLELLMKQYITEQYCEEFRLLEQLRFSKFLLWLQNQQEQSNVQEISSRRPGAATD